MCWGEKCQSFTRISYRLLMPGVLDVTTIQLSEFVIVAVIMFTALYGRTYILIAVAAPITSIAKPHWYFMWQNKGVAGMLAVVGE